MNSIKYTILFLLLLPAAMGMAQSKTFEHKIIAGFNFGATAPIPIPSEVRSINGWWPQFTPQLGYDVIYNHSEKWGIGSGILLDYKGMGVRDRVKYMYTSVVLEKEDRQTLNGYFVGKNETKVKSSYVTIPLYVTYKLSDNWRFKAGGYASYRFSSNFDGYVWGGYLRVVENEGDPLDGDKIYIENKGDATFNFGDEMRNFDFGLLGGAERRLNDRFGVYGNLSWGLTSIFPSGFRAISFNMYNIYLTLGLTYSL